MRYKNLILGGIGLLTLTLILSLPSVHIPDGPDKITHILIFFLYTVLLYEIYKAIKGRPHTWLPLIAIMIFLALAGALYEVFQKLFIPSRTGDSADWFADIVGSLIAFVYYFLTARKHRL